MPTTKPTRSTREYASDVLFENVREEKRNDFFCFLSDFDRTDRYHRPIIESHYHAYIELIYLTSGELKATISGKTLIGNPGDLFVIMPGEVHSFERKRGCKYACIQCDPAFIFSGIMSTIEFGYVVPAVDTCDPESKLFKSADIDNTDIPKQIHQILIAYENRDRFYRLTIRTGMSIIMLHILKKWDSLRESDNKVIPTNEKLVKLAPVLEIMNKDFRGNVRADEMAELLGLSNSYFSRLFYAAMGMGYTEYLNYLRINEAERLLVSTGDSVSEIAKAVGFSSTSYFITQFKKQFKISPKKYKQQYSNI